MKSNVLMPEIRTPSSLWRSQGLMVLDLIPVLVESAFVFSVVVVAVVMRMQKLTAGQFFWLVAVLLCIFIAVTMMFYIKYS